METVGSEMGREELDWGRGTEENGAHALGTALNSPPPPPTLRRLQKECPHPGLLCVLSLSASLRPFLPGALLPPQPEDSQGQVLISPSDPGLPKIHSLLLQVLGHLCWSQGTPKPHAQVCLWAACGISLFLALAFP